MLPGQCYKSHCYGSGTRICSSEPVMSRVPEELVGHVNRLQRSLFFTYCLREQGAHQLYISSPYAPGRQAIKLTHSSRNAACLSSAARLGGEALLLLSGPSLGDRGHGYSANPSIPSRFFGSTPLWAVMYCMLGLGRTWEAAAHEGHLARC